MRNAEITRKTKETDITVMLELDGSGKTDISTGIGFFDHMLTAFAVHGGMDLTVKVRYRPWKGFRAGYGRYERHNTLRNCVHSNGRSIGLCKS